MLWIVEHARAEAHPLIVSLENIEVPTTLATFPELCIVGQLGEGDGTVAEF